MACLPATSSKPYVDVSTVFYLFENHFTGVLLIISRIPVIDLLVSKSYTWSAS